jgi:hypothetical protein
MEQKCTNEREMEIHNGAEMEYKMDKTWTYKNGTEMGIHSGAKMAYTMGHKWK